MRNLARPAFVIFQGGARAVRIIRTSQERAILPSRSRSRGVFVNFRAIRRLTQQRSRPNSQKIKIAGGGGRTHTLLTEQGILSPVRLPVSPPRRANQPTTARTPRTRSPACGGRRLGRTSAIRTADGASTPAPR